MIGSVLAVGFALAGLLIFERDLPAEVVDAQYANAQSQFLRTDANDRIHFRDQGPSDAVPIILIHGANGSLHNYEEWARTLSKRYRVISLDLPGHGLTGETATDRYDMDTDLGTIRAVADHLALDRFVLAGHSMGGGVAMAFAQNSPDELLGLVLVSSVIPWRPRSDDPKPIGDAPPLDGNRNTEVNEQEKPKHRNSSTLSLFRLPGVRLIGRHIDPALVAERSARSAYGNEEMVTSALVQRYIDLSLREGSRGALFKRMASRANRLTSPPNFAGPVLIQWGSDDTWTPPSLIQPLIETFPYATVVTYDEVGHLPMEEIPLLSARDLLSFLDSISLEMNKKAKDDTIGPGSGGCDTIIAGQRLLQE